MKLRNIYYICQKSYAPLDGLTSLNTGTPGGKQGVKMKGWDQALWALMEIREIECYKEMADIILSAVPMNCANKDIVEINTQDWNIISKTKRSLLDSMKNTMALCEMMDGRTGEKSDLQPGIDVKMPECKNFSEYITYLKDLDFVLTKCCFLKVDGEELLFENVDVGSSWLTFVLAGTVAAPILLNTIAAFADKAVVVWSHYLSTKEQKEKIESSMRTKEQKAAILDYLSALYKSEVDTAIEEMKNITGQNELELDGEERDRTERCFKKIGELIDKGMQIHAAIDAPEETKVLFEPLEMKYLSISEGTKLLEENESESK